MTRVMKPSEIFAAQTAQGRPTIKTFRDSIGGDEKNYDFVLDSSQGLEASAEAICDYVKEKAYEKL